MAKKRTRRINITPDDLKVGGLRWLDNKFTFTFTQYRRQGDIEVVMHLDFWWIEYMAEHLHKVIKHAADKVHDAKCYMRGAT